MGKGIQNRIRRGARVASQQLPWLVVLGTFVTAGAFAGSRIIGGKKAGPGEFVEVVRIDVEGSPCTATLVGPRVISTAAHCGENGKKATFTVAGKNYSATLTRSTLFPQQDHDVALGLVDRDVEGVKPVAVGGVATVGLGLTIAGYGCTLPNGEGTEGELFYGETVVTGFRRLEMIAQEPGTAAVCLGDSGGPAYAKDTGGKFRLVGVSTKGNLTDKSLFARTDIPETQTFFKKFSADNGNAAICGVTSECGSEPPPPPPAPTCRLVATPPSVEVNKAVTIQLFASGNASTAEIDGKPVSLPNGLLKITKDASGTYTVRGSVTGPGGSNSCETNFAVTGGVPVAPTCSLAAAPPLVKVNEPTTITLRAQGNATSAAVEGSPVTLPSGTVQISKPTAGQYTVRGTVTGPGGIGNCETTFQVDGPIIPQAPSCQLTATPAVVKVGAPVTIELVSAGQATSATIDSVAVTLPIGKRTVRPERPGTFTVNGVVVGPGGQGFCTVAYSAQGDDPIPPPDTDNFAVVPVYCGENVLETPVAKVCLGILKRDESVGDLRTNQVLRITYIDGSVEVLPIIARKARTQEPGDLLVSEDLFLYTNVVLPAVGTEVLDTRKALLTKYGGQSRAAEVPVSLQGRTARNRAFVIDRLAPVPTKIATRSARR